MEDKYEKTGRLWIEPDAEIHKKGSITLNGKKGTLLYVRAETI